MQSMHYICGKKLQKWGGSCFWKVVMNWNNIQSSCVDVFQNRYIWEVFWI